MRQRSFCPVWEKQPMEEREERNQAMEEREEEIGERRRRKMR